MNYQQNLDELRIAIGQLTTSQFPEREQILKEIALDMARMQARILAALVVGWV
jgi:hypothetical protein